jgi:hypothetical protein
MDSNPSEFTFSLYYTVKGKAIQLQALRVPGG